MLYKYEEAMDLAKQWYNTLVCVTYDGASEDDANCGVFMFNSLLFDKYSVALDLKELSAYLDNAPGNAQIKMTLFKDGAFDDAENGNSKVLHASCQLSKENLKNTKEYGIDAFSISLTAMLKEMVHALLK